MVALKNRMESSSIDYIIHGELLQESLISSLVAYSIMT